MVNCNYCGGIIPVDRYVRFTYRIGVDKGYCSSSCQNRAMLLRRGIRNSKHMPVTINNVDKQYIYKNKRGRDDR